MDIFRAHSIFRLRITIPTLFGILTISLHAYGSVSYLLQPENLKIFIMSELALFLLLCGGYLMNDIFDLPYDRINRPGTVYIGKLINRNAAIVLFIGIFYIIAFLCVGCISIGIYSYFGTNGIAAAV